MYILGDSRIKIACLVTDLCFDGGGGAERVLSHVVNGLDRDRYDVAVISMLPFDEEQVRLRIPNARVYSLNMERGRANLQDIGSFGRIISDLNPHVVYCWMHHAILLGRVSEYVKPRQRVLITSFRSERSPSSSSVRAGLRVSRWLDAVSVAVSARVAEQICRERLAVHSRIRVIPNGVDTQRFRPTEESRRLARHELGISEDTLLFTALGRLEPAKGYSVLLKSFTEVVAAVPNARLVIAGEGSERHALEMQIDLLGLRSTVTLLGHVDEPGRVLTASDCHVLPSLWEGMSNSMLEAMSCGVLCVASDVGGVRDVITDGETGYVVPPGRHQDLATALVDIATTPALRRISMGARARQRILDAFSMKSLVDANDCMLRECCGAAFRET